MKARTWGVCSGAKHHAGRRQQSRDSTVIIAPGLGDSIYNYKNYDSTKKWGYRTERPIEYSLTGHLVTHALFRSLSLFFFSPCKVQFYFTALKACIYRSFSYIPEEWLCTIQRPLSVTCLDEILVMMEATQDVIAENWNARETLIFSKEFGSRWLVVNPGIAFSVILPLS